MDGCSPFPGAYRWIRAKGADSDVDFQVLRSGGAPAAVMPSVLSYFRDYFSPDSRAPRASHSTGQIAAHLYQVMSSWGPVTYLDDGDHPRGLSANLYVGHFWAFQRMATANDFAARVAFYVVADPNWTRRLLLPLAASFGVPVPEWDLPPSGFDHEATMELSDLVFLVGNSFTLSTFPARWHDKIRLLNYSVDVRRYVADLGVERRRNDFVYVATQCSLRKGFPDVVRTWAGVDPRRAQLHVVGSLAAPFDGMLAAHDNGSIVVHGFVPSDSNRYARLLQSCRFAYIPTYSEGQMGTVLEAIYAGCVPITTRESGVADGVLEHCVVVEPLDIAGQREAIERVLSWSEEEYTHRAALLISAATRLQSWDLFEERVHAGIGSLLPGSVPVTRERQA